MDDLAGLGSSDARRIRVLILASTYPRWRGDTVPAFVAEFAGRLAARGEQVQVLVPHSKGAARVEELDGIAVRRFRYWWPESGQDVAYGQYRGGLLSMVKGAMYTVLQASQTVHLARSADVVNAHWMVPQGFAAALAALVVRRPLVVTVHGGDAYAFNGLVGRRIKRWTLRRATAVVVNSSSTLRACRDLLERDDYAVIPMGVEDHGIAPRTRVKGAGLRLLFVGRLVEGKGVGDAIRALALARQEGVEMTLDVVGDGPERAALEQQARQFDVGAHVIFHGWVDHSQLGAWHARCDVLVVPSKEGARGWREGFGLVLVEAALSGRAAVAYRSGGIPDVVDDGVTGVLVDEGDEVALARALIALARTPALLEAMGDAARERALSRFTWDGVDAAYARVFESARAGGAHTYGESRDSRQR